MISIKNAEFLVSNWDSNNILIDIYHAPIQTGLRFLRPIAFKGPSKVGFP